MGEFDESVMGIAQGGKRVVIGGEVSADLRSGFGGVRVDQPEIGAVAKFFAERSEQRGIAIGDGTIGTDEKEYKDAAVQGFQRIDGLALEIFGE